MKCLIYLHFFNYFLACFFNNKSKQTGIKKCGAIKNTLIIKNFKRNCRNQLCTIQLLLFLRPWILNKTHGLLCFGMCGTGRSKHVRPCKLYIYVLNQHLSVYTSALFSETIALEPPNVLTILVCISIYFFSKFCYTPFQLCKSWVNARL